VSLLADTATNKLAEFLATAPATIGQEWEGHAGPHNNDYQQW
jgi:hypothetical protein